MTHRIVIFIFLIYLQLRCTVGLCSDELVSANEVMQKAVSTRKDLFDSVRASVTESVRIKDSQEKRFRYDVIAKGDKFRCDRQASLGSTEKWSPIEKQSFNSSHIIEDIAQEEGVAISIRPLETRDSIESNIFAFHPNSIGMAFGGLSGSSRNGFKSFLRWFKSAHSKKYVTDEDGNYTLTHQVDGGANVSVVIDTSKAYSVLEATVSMNTPSGIARENMTVLYDRVGKDEKWFPKECIFETTIDGSWYKTKKISIDNVEINTQVDDSVFNLTGMDIQSGRGVYIYENTTDPPMAYVWDGDELTLPKAKPSPPLDSKERSNLLIWINVLVCGALGLILLIRSFSVSDK